MTVMTNTTNPALKELLDAGHRLATEDMRVMFVVATGLVLPSPGDRVSWRSRFGGVHTGTVDDVYATRRGIEARVEQDRTGDRPHKATHFLDVYDLTYHSGCATVGRVADETGRLILAGGAS